MKDEDKSRDELMFELKSLRAELVRASGAGPHDRTLEHPPAGEAFYRAIVEDLTEPISRFSPDGTLTFVNDAYCSFFGEAREELIGRTFWHHLPEEECRRLRDFLASFSHRDPVKTVEHRVLDASGAVKWLQWTDRAFFNQEGEIIGFQAVARDVTERKRAERDYRTLFQEMLDGFALHEIICDTGGEPADYRFLAVNPAFERLTGLKARDILGKTVLEALPRTERHWIETYGRVALTGVPAHFEDYHLELDRHYEVTAFRPAPRQFACIFTDITERKRAEQERRKLQDRMAEMQKMESVGRLAGGVAHDFNNMLGVILGHTEMALDQVDQDQPLYADLHEIHKAAERSAELTRQLLAFARKQTIAPKVLDLNETVEGMLKMLRRLIGEDIDLLWLPGAELWPVKMDPSQIHQILANLCINARDAISGVGKIILETAKVEFEEGYCANHAGLVPGRYISLAVSDDGHGMDRKTQEKVFEPFFTTKGLGQGTGLGLATVYGVVKQNNGFINVCSEPGRGTTFKIYLPGHTGGVEKSAQKGFDKAAGQGRETILLVEDEPAVLQMTTRMFERLGYIVIAASRPGEAISLAEAHPGEIHLLMTDVIMPEMNGRELANNLLSLHPNLKPLFMSGYSADVIAHRGILHEGAYFIQKPFSKRDLAAKVREVLEQGRITPDGVTTNGGSSMVGGVM